MTSFNHPLFDFSCPLTAILIIKFGAVRVLSSPDTATVQSPQNTESQLKTGFRNFIAKCYSVMGHDTGLTGNLLASLRRSLLVQDLGFAQEM